MSFATDEKYMGSTLIREKDLQPLIHIKDFASIGGTHSFGSIFLWFQMKESVEFGFVSDTVFAN